MWGSWGHDLYFSNTCLQWKTIHRFLGGCLTGSPLVPCFPFSALQLPRLVIESLVHEVLTKPSDKLGLVFLERGYFIE